MKLSSKKAHSAKSVLFIAGAIASVSTLSAHAYEYKETNGHAAVVDGSIALGAAGSGVASRYLGKEMPALTTKVLQETEIGERLTPAKIDEIMDAIQKSPTSQWKMGDRGGGLLKIKLDLNQYDNYVATQNANHIAGEMKGTATHIAGIDQTLNGGHQPRGGYTISERPSGVRAFGEQVAAVNGNFKPRWGELPKPINVAKSGAQGTRAQLEMIMNSGARIQKISLHSLASRAILPKGLTALGTAFDFAAITHLISGAYRGVISLGHKAMDENDAVCRPQSHCADPNVFQKAAISSAPVPSWVPGSGAVSNDAR